MTGVYNTFIEGYSIRRWIALAQYRMSESQHCRGWYAWKYEGGLGQCNGCCRKRSDRKVRVSWWNGATVVILRKVGTWKGCRGVHNFCRLFCTLIPPGKPILLLSASFFYILGFLYQFLCIMLLFMVPLKKKPHFSHLFLAHYWLPLFNSVYCWG